MNKIVKSLAVVAFVGAIAIGATSSYFSDTETSTGNTFTAGAIDLKIDSHATYNGQDVANGTWALKDLVGDTKDAQGLTVLGDRFFNFADVKPGDSGENTISLHVDNNDAWGCVNIIPTKNDDVSSNEPELEAGDAVNTDSIFDGELAQNMIFTIWADVGATGGAVPGDNKYQKENGDILLGTSAGPLAPITYALATPAGNVFNGSANSPLVGTQTYYIGAGWSIPNTVGNIIQTDTYQADVSFYVIQSRNNANFVCPSVAPAAKTLRLENETIVEGGPWTVINDNTYADLTWVGDGNTFDYTLTAQGLPNNTNYSLIYYADGWPGNNPGKLIGNYTSSGTGTITSGSVSIDLGMDLPSMPDGNFTVGAKIWLVLASDYNAGTSSMIAWNPSQYLFEGNVYINYQDLNN
ncbi:MAG: TasA family protein [Candidatus Paceibacterota bacterium]|jgi:predicted ribosomally synthesized peptide with SipW-like signal peptide